MNNFVYIIVILFTMSACATTQKFTAIEGMPADAPIQTIQLVGKDCDWVPNKISVVQGAHVILEVQSADYDYNFLMKHYKLKFDIPAKQTVKAEFYAADAGEYEFGCFIEEGRNYVWGGMVGTLTVAGK